jgi:hypothetical protein
LVPFPDLFLDTILSLSFMDHSFDLMTWFLLWHALSTVWPFQIMSNQFNLWQVDSNYVVETSRMINWNNTPKFNFKSHGIESEHVSKVSGF